MAGIARRVLVFLTVLQFASVPLSGYVLADGGVISKHGELVYLPEDSQYGIIDYSGGVQRMLISIEFEWQDLDDVAWILPIPSDPDQMNTDIVDGAPTFFGVDVVEEARETVTDSTYAYLIGYAGSALLPLPITLVFSRTFLGFGGYAGSLGEGGLGGDGTEVIVHSHIEKYGLVVEVISATEGQGIYNYLTGQGLDVSEGALPQLDEYVDMDYCFVVTWVEYSTADTRELGIVMEFPTEDVYYPLMLTSIYGDEVVPMSVVVTRHVVPELYSEIRPYTDVRYFHGGDVYLDWGENYAPETELFVDMIQSGWDGKWTLMEISAPSKKLKDDLWMKEGAPSNVNFAPTVSRTFGGLESLLVLYLIVFVASVLSALLAGRLVIGWDKKYVTRYLILAFANLGGLLIFYLTAEHFRKRLSIPKYSYQRFIPLFIGVFIGLSLAMFLPFYVLLL